jgi:hypothetical protein
MHRMLAALYALIIALSTLGLTPAGPVAAESSPVLRPSRPCSQLQGLSYDIPGAAVRITAADGSDNMTCDVHGTVDPAVQFELKLPINTFTGRYVQYGCSGDCGKIFPPAKPSCSPPQGGDFAVAATDDGHIGDPNNPLFDASWGANNQAARDDFFYRAPHVVALAAKQLIAVYYGEAPKRSYFVGCSTGGREGLLLAQRYPHDFNGIVAGDPTNYMGPLMGVYMTWIVRSNTGSDGKPILTADKLGALHNAVLAACDGLDGLVDGQIDDPTACHFDPGTLQCPAGTDQASCLTSAQVEVVRKLYAGPTDEHGSRLFPGGEPAGSELAWAGSIIPIETPYGAASLAPLPDGYLKYLGYPIGQPASSVADFHFTSAEFRRLIPEGVKGNAMSLDLSAFKHAGGKLILWHGWADQSIPPAETLDYYQRLWEHNGGLRETQRFARLFMVPTLYHCGLFGGYRGSNSDFDPFQSLVDWVESSHAPERIVANQRDANNVVVRSRPVFAYPERAQYTGYGSIDDASNFVSAPPLSPPHNVIRWLGDGLYGMPGPVANTGAEEGPMDD